jgi:alkanesulfonate monooxygenase SsuD/methylene tetrahydromethanopterin reductase-like flavin-dependent oxidoreductase (luciferase family)
MEFGVFAQGAVPAPMLAVDPDAEHHRLLDNVELGVFAEECGFKYVWASEHHFLREYSHMSCPEVYLPFVAARTTRIHLGSSIMNVTAPVNHPYRVAERVATLDHLTEGRFEFGTGRGSSSTEMNGFGIEDMDDSKQLWAESARLIPQLWREPERNILPEPYTRPHPPMWVAAGSPSTFEKAARHGLGVICFSFGDPQTLAPLIARYKELIQDPSDPLGDWVNNNVMAVNQMVVLDDRDEAFLLASEIGLSYYQALVVRWLDSFPRPDGFPRWPAVPPEPTPEVLEVAAKMGAMICGDPDDARAALSIWQEIGVDQLVFSPLTTQISLEDAKRTMAVFGKHVIPDFDTHPDIHRTTLQREAQTTGGTR